MTDREEGPLSHRDLDQIEQDRLERIRNDLEGWLLDIQRIGEEIEIEELAPFQKTRLKAALQELINKLD